MTDESALTASSSTTPVATSLPVPSSATSSLISTNRHVFPLIVLAALSLIAIVVMVLTNHEVPGVILDSYPLLLGAVAGVTYPRSNNAA